MSSRLFDGRQIRNAMHNEALPALERLAENPTLLGRSLRRFENEEPPPYASSTEDEDEADAEYMVQKGPNAVPEEIKARLRKPLDDEELRGVTRSMWDSYKPGPRFRDELNLEMRRVRTWAFWTGGDTYQYFEQIGPARKGRAGIERSNVLARHLIKRRWQKLGIWNPEWGIPPATDHLAHPAWNTRTHESDNSDRWKWSWQRRDVDELEEQRDQHSPVRRAMELRRGLLQIEHHPVVPRSHLRGDDSASQAEAFITSRPSFVFAAECTEEGARWLHRLESREYRRYRKSKAATDVERCWKEAGEWKDEWREREILGWKWRHESPSPEPEELSGPFDPEALELTPSELDALDAIPPPSPSPSPSPPLQSWELLDIFPPGQGSGIFSKSGLQEPSTQAQQPVQSDEQLQRPPLRRQRPRRQPPTGPLRRSPRIAALASRSQEPGRIPRRRARPTSCRTKRTRP